MYTHLTFPDIKYLFGASKLVIFKLRLCSINYKTSRESWIAENIKFDYLRTKRAFESALKQKRFFLVSQVLFFRHAKQISKNVADTAFKDKGWFIL